MSRSLMVVMKGMMMTIDLQQLQASSPQESTWLIANAGSGKTKVLVDRLLRLLLSGARPGGILCLTFTVTAANEMLKRVQDVLGRWLILDDDALDAEITVLGEQATAQNRKQARKLFLYLAEDPEGLNIRTLHGFCQSLISRFPLELGLAPSSSLIDEEEARILKENLRQAVLLDEDPILATARNTVLMHAQALASKEHFARFGTQIEKWNLPFEEFDSQVFLQKYAQNFDLQPDQLTPDAALQNFLVAVQRLQVVQVAELIQAKELQTNDLKFLNRLLEALNQDDWHEGFIAAFLTKGKMRKRLITKALQKDDFIAKRVEFWKECVQTYKVHDTIVQSIQASMAFAPLMCSFAQRYTAYKTEHALLDYGDQIALVQRLLCSSGGLDWIRYKLDCHIDHVFLDEAQDTSDSQWAILRALCDDFFDGEKERNQTLFVVGDPKQSIYRFQGADPEGFFSERDMRTDHGDVSACQLSRSYRSAQAVLDVVDATFDVYRQQDFAASDSTFADTEHKSARPGVAASVILAPPLMHSYGGSQRQGKQWLAQHLAETIHGWIGQRALRALGRTVQPEDILVLFRDRRGLFASLAHHLRRLGVPVASGESSQFLQPLPILDIVALLRYLLFRDADYQLACVLKSAFIGIAEADLMQLALQRGEQQSLHGVLMQCQDDPRYAPAAAWLASLRQMSDFTTINSLLGAILHQPCPLGRSGLQALKGRFGDGVEQVLSRLERLAITFEETESTGLQGFVDHVLFRESTVTDRVEGAGVVRLMTVHGAKGLQAPIVIMPETYLTAKAIKTPALYDIGGIPFWDMGGQIVPEKLQQKREALKAAERAEHWRLLYVAMTRAAYELHLYMQKPLPKQANKDSATPWYSLIDTGLEKLDAEEYTDIKAFPVFDGAGAGFSTEKNAKRYQSFQSIPVPMSASHDTPSIDDAPDWLFTPAVDTMPFFMPNERVMRSSGTDQSNLPRLRGIALHAVLEGLCGADQSSFPMRIDAALLQHSKAFSQSALAEMRTVLMQVIAVAEIASFLQQADSEIEVALPTGEVRRLDCVRITADRVVVVDFKSDQDPVAFIPSAYRAQLGVYCAILAQIFPNHTIEAGILWLNEARIAWLDVEG